MARDIRRGKWFDIINEEQFKNLKQCGRLEYNSFWTARVQIGTYNGPGRYMVLSYQQRCPRNCCYDSVHEVMSVADVVDIIKEEMKELAELLKLARTKE